VASVTTHDEDLDDARVDQLLDMMGAAFGYTADNNRDLIADPTFSMQEVWEELHVQHCYEFLLAYVNRNRSMIASNLED
jgi:hypothetical protein